MADFKLNTEEATADKTISVDTIGGDAPKPGKYRFSLVVASENNLKSDPVEITVTVVSLEAKLRAVNTDGVEFPDNKVKAGERFFLSAEGSNAGDEPVKGFIFTLLEGP
jgi:uncharacterized membrane protein